MRRALSLLVILAFLLMPDVPAAAGVFKPPCPEKMIKPPVFQHAKKKAERQKAKLECCGCPCRR